MRSNKDIRANRRAKRYRDRSNWPAATVIAAVVAVMIPLIVTTIRRQDEPVSQPTPQVSWNPSWPPLPATNLTPAAPMAEIQNLYAFVARQADLLQYIPCYCGCEREGHRSNEDCYIHERSATGEVAKWDTHAFT